MASLGRRHPGRSANHQGAFPCNVLCSFCSLPRRSWSRHPLSRKPRRPHPPRRLPLHHLQPVSYTHLDVYKRQAEGPGSQGPDAAVHGAGAGRLPQAGGRSENRRAAAQGVRQDLRCRVIRFRTASHPASAGSGRVSACGRKKPQIPIDNVDAAKRTRRGRARCQNQRRSNTVMSHTGQ